MFGTLSFRSALRLLVVSALVCGLLLWAPSAIAQWSLSPAEDPELTPPDKRTGQVEVDYTAILNRLDCGTNGVSYFGNQYVAKVDGVDWENDVTYGEYTALCASLQGAMQPYPTYLYNSNDNPFLDTLLQIAYGALTKPACSDVPTYPWSSKPGVSGSGNWYQGNFVGNPQESIQVTACKWSSAGTVPGYGLIYGQWVDRLDGSGAHLGPVQKLTPF